MSFMRSHRHDIPRMQFAFDAGRRQLFSGSISVKIGKKITHGSRKIVALAAQKSDTLSHSIIYYAGYICNMQEHILRTCLEEKWNYCWQQHLLCTKPFMK